MNNKKLIFTSLLTVIAIVILIVVFRLNESEKEIELQNKQFNLLEYLLLNKGSILLKEQIYDRVWGIDSDVTIEIVEVYISHLRKKLSKYGYDKCIKTKRKVGYMFDDK